jgi:dihydrofolate reductase
MFTTLDGFIAGPNGEFDDYEPSAEEMRFANRLFASMDGILFGRVIYEGFVEYWDALDINDTSNNALDIEFAGIFRKLTRVVFSRTLEGVPENTILIKDNIAEEVSRLKQQPGNDLLLICGPELLASLVKDGLVDEYRIMVRPAVRGRGMALFGQIPESQQLQLMSIRVFESSTVMHHYQVINDQPEPSRS